MKAPEVPFQGPHELLCTVDAKCILARFTLAKAIDSEEAIFARACAIPGMCAAIRAIGAHIA